MTGNSWGLAYLLWLKLTVEWFQPPATLTESKTPATAAFGLINSEVVHSRCQFKKDRPLHLYGILLPRKELELQLQCGME